jgi:glycosyltransferase involved in cell wall biosynthesis
MKPLPLISCIMPTYGRPEYVNESVAMFLAQDYPRKELIILNDCAGQQFEGDFPDVHIVNQNSRFASLGEKRNTCIQLAKGSVIAVWDDDDVYLPWRLSFSYDEMNRLGTPFYRPAEFWAYWGDENLRNNQSVPGWISHPWVMFNNELLLLLNNGRMERPGVDEGGYEYVEGKYLVLNWDRWTTEKLIWDETMGNYYQDTSKAFTLVPIVL